jgi:uncharacterized protein YbgA (DUF1722 family)/uncharacterized protein YbbK (DUF523 family)
VSDDRPRIGISACLLGDPVRFDAGHKRDGFLVETFGPYVEWIKVCPEVEAGFGTPRDPMRLVAGASGSRTGDGVRLIVIKTGEDVTTTLRDYSLARADELAAANLSGYILKKDSPSCGMARVKVYRGGVAERTGRGLFADALLSRLPNLPVEEEGRLSDPRLRENFIERVFAYRRLRALFDRRWRIADLVRFHTAHKLTLMAHAPAAYARLGRLVAGAATHPRAALASAYETQFMQALAKVATPKRHANVLQHMLGYFKTSLDADARAELLALIEDHRAGRVPLVVPMTLMRHHVRRRQVAYLAGQSYLDPHPRELSLRNHV